MGLYNSTGEHPVSFSNFTMLPSQLANQVTNDCELLAKVMNAACEVQHSYNIFTYLNLC